MNKIPVVIEIQRDYEPQKIICTEPLVAGIEIRLATALVEKWGMVLGMEDGEDSSGRHKLRLATPGEVVDRAVATTKVLIARFIAEDWFHDSSEALAELADRRLQREQERGR